VFFCGASTGFLTIQYIYIWPPFLMVGVEISHRRWLHLLVMAGCRRLWAGVEERKGYVISPAATG
jgi:hypothetical protein